MLIAEKHFALTFRICAAERILKQPKLIFQLENTKNRFINQRFVDTSALDQLRQMLDIAGVIISMSTPARMAP